MNAASSPRGSPRIKKKVQGQGQGHQDKRPYCLMKYRFNLPFLALGAIVVGTCVAAFTASPKLNLATSTFIQRGRAGQSSSVGTQLQLAVPHARSRADKTLTSLSMSEPEGGEGDDLADWKALVAAFKMYKAAYGDLRVPLRFIVPSMPPWPKSAWGMKLGHRVAAIRSTGQYVQNDENRRQLLEEMGFVWRLRTVSQDKSMKGITYEQIYDALACYKKVVKDNAKQITVPVTFVVPDADPWPESTRGLPLGKKISTMKGKTFLAKNPEVGDKLRELGLELDTKTAVNDSRFQKVFDALVRYKEIYADLLVPQPFVVPDNSEEWPENTWGLRLGARVNAIRSQGTFVKTDPSRRLMLDDIGFVWTPPPTERGRKRGRKNKQEIAAEEAQFVEAGAPATSQDSTIAAMDNLFGPSFDFGTDMTKGSPKEPSKWGLEGEPLLEERLDEKSKAEAEADYVEPVNLKDALAAATERAVEAGIILEMTEDDKRIRKGKQYKSIPLYNDDFGEDWVFDDVVEALTVYKKIYGDFSNFTRANTDFIVPASESNEFSDEEATAFDTAASARAAAAIAAYEEEGRSSESENLIASEIKRLQEEVETPYSMATEVEQEVVKSTNVQWPEHLAGMQLGYIVKRIKDGSLEVKHLPKRKAALDAIDFEWGDEKYFLSLPFEKAMCAFYGYYMVRGDMFVWDDFVMPDEDPWPTALAGYEIGKAVKRVRELQNFIEAYHPDKVQMLRMIEFVWFPSLALPLDPTKGDPTEGERICESYGHPNYFELPEMPPTLIEKIFENGPVVESDDPKEWYKQYYDWEYVKDIWYDLGCRDRAFALHRRGYEELAAEHAAKYGTGFYDELLEMLSELHDKTKELGSLDNLDDASKKEYTANLLKWRETIAGTCDFSAEELTDIDESIDDYLADILNETEIDLDEEAAAIEKAEDSFEDDGSVVEEAVLEDEAYEFVEVEEASEIEGGEDAEYEYEYEYEYVDEEEDAVPKEGAAEEDEIEVDVEDELGLSD